MDDFPIWLCCFLPLFIVIWMEYENLRKEKQRRILGLIQKNRKRGLEIMSEAFKKFIGKECIITTMNSSVVGVVEETLDNWILIRKGKGADDMINVDYIIRIQENKKSRG